MMKQVVPSLLTSLGFIAFAPASYASLVAESTDDATPKDGYVQVKIDRTIYKVVPKGVHLGLAELVIALIICMIGTTSATIMESSYSFIASNGGQYSEFTSGQFAKYSEMGSATGNFGANIGTNHAAGLQLNKGDKFNVKQTLQTSSEEAIIHSEYSGDAGLIWPETYFNLINPAMAVIAMLGVQGEASADLNRDLYEGPLNEPFEFGSIELSLKSGYGTVTAQNQIKLDKGTEL